MEAVNVYGLSYHMDCFSVGRIRFSLIKLSLICRKKCFLHVSTEMNDFLCILRKY